jgi:hypothetical protein
VTRRSCVDEDHFLLAGGGWDAGVERGVDHRQATPKRAAVVGTWNRPLVMTRSTTPEVSCGPSRILLTWLLTLCTAHRRLPATTMPSTRSIG